MMDHPLFADQLALEETMREATRARYFKIHENAEDRGELADTHAGTNLFQHCFEVFLLGMKAWVKDRKEGVPGRRPRAVKMIEEFGDDETLAFIFVQHLINATLSLQQKNRGHRARFTRVALATTQAIHDELRMRYFAENRRPLLRRIVEDFNRRDLPRRRRRELMIKQFHTQQLTWQAEGWGQSERINLGAVLIDIFERTTGLLEVFTYYEGVKSIKCVTFTPDLVEAMLDRMDSAADMFTVFYPTIIPPKPWSNNALIGGGYYSENVKPYKLVKGATIPYLSELEGRDMSKVLGPVNAMQDTAWRVNPQMLDVLEHVYSHNMEVTGLPSADPKEIPPKPPMADEDEDVSKEYRKDCYMVHDSNRRMVSKRISVLRTLAMANRFSQYDAIYFPYDLDSRGRAYPKPAFLNPQGPDYVKALLEFSGEKPINAGDGSLYYLTIAIANAWGQDKLPLDERAGWVEENQEMLFSVAEDPYGDLRWLQADEPFMALRGAMEFLGYAEYGDGYLSHMPVHFDATCSGLQHFSALLKDAEGGFYVNLTGSEGRQDIYAEVARKATETLFVEANTSHIASLALDIGVSRSLCKRPVMIVPYAGTFSSCMEYVNDHYRERVEAGEDLGMELSEIRRTLTPVVAKHVWDAIAHTVIAAREAMDWITHTARMVTKGKPTPIQWTTPDGFVIQQAKFEERTRRVETYLDGSRMIKLSYVVDTRNLDARQMAQSLSPNYIHSLDACHMRSSILKAQAIGGMSFAMIHDSFGVHAADMQRFLGECIKPAFVEMYEDGQGMERFQKELTSGLSSEDLEKLELRELPIPGDLDVRNVIDSQFFFS